VAGHKEMLHKLTEDLGTCFPVLLLPGDALSLEAPLRGLTSFSSAPTLRFFEGFDCLSSSSASLCGVETLSFRNIASVFGGQANARL
jgi:hypothetical protein